MPPPMTPGAATSGGGSRLRRIGAALGLTLLGGATFAGTAFLADRLTDRSDEVVVRAPGSPVSIQVPSATEAGAVDPGAEVTLDEPGPPIEGIPGGDFVLPPHLVQGEGPGTNDKGVGLPEGAAGTAPIVTAKDAPALAEKLATVSLTPPPAFTSFVDNCTTGATPCPIGVAATVKASPYATPMAIHMKLWPGITKAIYPGLRCDPGYATAERYPLVITVDEPIAQGSVKLSLGAGSKAGPQLDDVLIDPRPSEKAWYDQQVASGKKPGTDLGDSQHYCVSLRTEGHPDNVAKLQGKSVPTPIVYRIWGKVVPLEGAQPATATVDVPAPVLGPRPPTVVKPLTGHVAQVIIPERESGDGAKVWLIPRSEWWVNGIHVGAVEVCAIPTAGGELPTTGETFPLVAPETSTYPYDRTYSRFSVRNLVLQEASTYALCIAWTTPKGVEREAIEIRTPDGFVFEARVHELRVTDRKPFADVWTIYADPPADCRYSWSSEVELLPWGSKSYWKGSGGWLCNSRGLPWPPFTTFRMRKDISVESTADTPAHWVYFDMGSDWSASPTWCWMWTSCGDPNFLMPPMETTFEWRDPCLGSGCDEEYVRASVRVTVRSIEGEGGSGQRDPLDWFIQGPPKLYGPGQGGSDAGTGFPEPGP